MNAKNSASVLAMVAALSFAHAALAAEANVGASDDSSGIETVTVTGYRGSLIKAEEIKKDALGTQDSIVAEDIAQFPEQNLADALQRIPGLTINRESGEGRQIQLRGLGPDFTQVTLNGMEALSTASSAYDSRGSVSRSRGFDYNVFAAELFKRVDVYKSYSADLDEGGLAGTVALHTPRPFDYDGFKGVLSAQAGGNTNTDKMDGRYVGLFSDTWGKFGALLSFSYNKRYGDDVGYDTVRWRKVNAQGADISALDPATQALINSKSLWFPRGARPVIFEDGITRMGFTGAFQYKPTENLLFSLDLLYGELDNDRHEYHIQHATGTSTGMGCYTLTNNGVKGTPVCSSVTALTYNALDEVTSYSLKNTTLTSESAAEMANSKIRQGVFNVDWKITDKLHLTGLVGHEDSYFIDNKAKVYMIITGDMTLDYTHGFMGHNTYLFNTTDPSKYQYQNFDIWQPVIKNKFDDAKLDLAYDITDDSRVSVGASAKKYSNTYTVNEIKYSSYFDAGTFSRTVDPALSYVDTSHPENRWLSANVNGVYAKYGVQRMIPEPSYDNLVREKDYAAYLLYEFHGWDLPWGSLRGNAGLRFFRTDTSADGIVGGTPVVISKHYTDILPAVNLAWDVTPKIVIRADVSKNVSRPDLGSLNPSGTVHNDASAGDLTISAGNPGLKPMTSMNYDLGLEYYFSRTGYVSLSLFKKDLKNLIGSSLTKVRFGDTGYPLSFLGTVDANGNPQTADTIYDFSRPINLDSAHINGLEIAVKRDFDFLPAPFDKLGIIANYTHVLGDALYPNVQGTGVAQWKAFTGLSKNTANATLYYETDDWGARISAAYRSHYILAVQSGNTDEDERGFHDTTFVDFTAFYNFSPNIRVNFDMLNLTDEPYEEYSDTDNRLYSATTSGRIYSVRATYTF